VAVNAKSLLKRLYSLARHPNPYRRLGSALTFHQVYRVLRVEPSLVIAPISYFINLLYNILANIN
jgi:hypothetical protein